MCHVPLPPLPSLCGLEPRLSDLELDAPIATRPSQRSPPREVDDSKGIMHQALIARDISVASKCLILDPAQVFCSNVTHAQCPAPSGSCTPVSHFLADLGTDTPTPMPANGSPGSAFELSSCRLMPAAAADAEGCRLPAAEVGRLAADSLSDNEGLFAFSGAATGFV